MEQENLIQSLGPEGEIKPAVPEEELDDPSAMGDPADSRQPKVLGLEGIEFETGI